MALTPGRRIENLSIEDLRLADNVFAEIVSKREIPASFTPHNVDEIGIGGHKSVVKEVLARFGRYGNFSTEYNATSLPPVDQSRIKSRYKKVLDWRNQANIGDYGMKKHYPVEMKRLNKAPLNYSSRLHALVMAHTPEWENEKAPKWNENSQAVYIFMSDMIGPKLGFKYKDDSPSAPGDYNLLVAWAFKNVEMIKKLYFMKDDPAHIDTQLARGIGVDLNQKILTTLVDGLRPSVTFNAGIESTPIEKLHLPVVELAVAPKTSIVRDFEQYFVDPLQKNGVEGIGAILPQDVKEDMDNDDAARYFARLNSLSLLNLAILKDFPGNSGVIKRLDAKLGFGGKLPEMLKEYIDVVTLAQSEGSIYNVMDGETTGGSIVDGHAIMQSLNAYRPEWNHTLSDVIDIITSEMSNGDFLGCGSGRAVLAHYNHAVINNASNKERLLQHMGIMVKLARAEGNLRVDHYKTEQSR